MNQLNTRETGRLLADRIKRKVDEFAEADRLTALENLDVATDAQSDLVLADAVSLHRRVSTQLSTLVEVLKSDPRASIIQPHYRCVSVPFTQAQISNFDQFMVEWPDVTPRYEYSQLTQQTIYQEHFLRVLLLRAATGIPGLEFSLNLFGMPVMARVSVDALIGIPMMMCEDHRVRPHAHVPGLNFWRGESFDRSFAQHAPKRCALEIDLWYEIKDVER